MSEARTSWKQWLGVTPTPDAQQGLLDELRSLLTPLLIQHKVPQDYALQPGLRLRTRMGMCRRPRFTQPEILVRCVKPGRPPCWRAPGGLVVTLLHEAAHLRYGGHGPRFWTLLRRLVNAAHAVGVYDPKEDDPEERAAGDGKLADSAARSLATAAALHRREQWRANRAALAGWEVGDSAVIPAGRTRAALRVTVLAKRRTRLVVADSRGRRYLAAAGGLQRG